MFTRLSPLGDFNFWRSQSTSYSLCYGFSAATPKQNIKYVYSGGFRENTTSGFVLRIAAESKMPKEVGYPNKDGVLLSDDPEIFS